MHDEAKAIVHALNNDRNQAQKARLEARMATTQINQKIHDIAEARWKMLPIAVQREHDILAMDISELQWHVKQEKQELMKAEEKLDYASTINKRLKADIDFNKNHSPLVEEKLRLEQAAMTEIKKEQVHQDEVLLHSRAQLKVEEEKFERRTSKINANKQKYEDKLDRVTKTLNEIKNELEAKESGLSFFHYVILLKLVYQIHGESRRVYSRINRLLTVILDVHFCRKANNLIHFPVHMSDV